MRRLDLTGQRFGKLTAIEYVGNKKWRCICDCGKTIVARTAGLRNGETKSCGCGRYGYSDPDDFVGKQFGELVVEEIIRGGKSGHIRCRCICSCGNQTIAILSQLRKGATVSCGCHKRKVASERMKQYALKRVAIHIGDKFGRLTIIKRGSVKNGHATWICRCDCGALCTVSGKHLTDGGTKSCGCLAREFQEGSIVPAQKNNPMHIRKNAYEAINGKVPEDYYVISLDGNASNLASENLMAVKKQTYNNLLRKSLLGNGEATKTFVFIDELERKIREANLRK